MAEFSYENTRIEELLSKAERVFKQRFVEAVRDIRNSVTLQELELLLVQRRFDDALIVAETAATNLANAYVTAYVLAAEDAFEFVSNSIGITVRFDQTNVRAVQQMRQASLRLIAEFTSGQRAATRAALVEGVRQGLNPREQATLFRQSIGLTAKQARAVANFRRSLESGSAVALQRQLRDKRFDPTVRAAVSGKKPLSKEQIDRMVQRYYERSLVHRSEVIARTEALRAVHQGSDEGFLQMADEGLISELSQVWHTAGDGRVRHPSHTRMNGQVRPFGEPFLSGTGNLLRYPGDLRAPALDSVQCRCVKTTQFTADVIREAA